MRRSLLEEEHTKAGRTWQAARKHVFSRALPPWGGSLQSWEAVPSSLPLGESVAMYMSRFSVKNYKCLADVDIPLTPIHVLIGPNDAGKTSVLEAMAAFYSSSEAHLAAVLPEPWAGSDLVFQGSPEARLAFSGQWRASDDEEPTVDASDASYDVTFAFAPGTKACVNVSDSLRVRGERVGIHHPGQRAEGAAPEPVLRPYSRGRSDRRHAAGNCVDSEGTSTGADLVLERKSDGAAGRDRSEPEVPSGS